MNARVLKTSKNADLNLGKTHKPYIDSLEVPLIIHSNYEVCWPITDYLLYRYLWKNLKLGTIKDDAYLLITFLEYLDINNLQFEDVHDRHLIAYSSFLFHERKKGQANQVNKNLRRVISFLLWYDDKINHRDPNRKKLISKVEGYSQSSSQITVHVQRNKWIGATRGYSRETLIHSAFLPESAPEKRHPIPDDTIKRLWISIPKVCKSLHRAKRDELLITLFECVGARRSEIFELTVSDCLEAIRSGNLKISTKKQRKKEWRSIPIDKSLANKLNEYIKYVRAPVIKEAIQRGLIRTEHGTMFIGKHGRRWKETSFNKELDLLAQAAGIETPVSPHLFRHKYGSMLAKNSKNLSPAQQRLYIKKLGGWSSDQSADIYIHLDWEADQTMSKLRETKLETDEYRESVRSASMSIARARELINDDDINNELQNLELQLKKLSSFIN